MSMNPFDEIALRGSGDRATPSTQPVTREQAEALIPQFVQWQQKASSAPTPELAIDNRDAERTAMFNVALVKRSLR